MPVRTLADADHLPALERAYIFDRPAIGLGPSDPPPRILLLYGSLRERSYSRLCIEEAARLMQELVRFTVLMRPHATLLVDRYSERKEAGVPLDRAKDLSSIAIDGR